MANEVQLWLFIHGEHCGHMTHGEHNGNTDMEQEEATE